MSFLYRVAAEISELKNNFFPQLSKLDMAETKFFYKRKKEACSLT